MLEQLLDQQDLNYFHRKSRYRNRLHASIRWGQHFSRSTLLHPETI